MTNNTVYSEWINNQDQTEFENPIVSQVNNQTPSQTEQSEAPQATQKQGSNRLSSLVGTVSSIISWL